MSIAVELLVLQFIILAAWVLVVHGIRIRKLERVPRSPLSAQIGALQDQVRKLQAEHDQAIRRHGRQVQELSLATQRLERDVQALGVDLADIPDAVADRLLAPEHAAVNEGIDGFDGGWIPTTGRPHPFDRKAG